MSRSFWFVALSVLVLISCTASAVADGINPPPSRGQPGTTFAKSSFLTSNPMPVPDVEPNPCGPASADANPCGSDKWYAEWAAREGVLPLSGNMSVTIQNNPVADMYEDTQGQLNWDAQEPGTRPIVGEQNCDAIARQVQEMQLDRTLIHTAYGIRIVPNPVWERVYIEGQAMPYELVTDSTAYAFCAPEPSSLVTLAGSMLGLAGVLWRRRRQAL